ncbi:MAG: sugar ABC transporter ATP-binding protein [Microbacteriaceae bacterium]|nr:MAG: sugar ABC transporter ATP-binding protein [Microbacteriaceae bacterium]
MSATGTVLHPPLLQLSDIEIRFGATHALQNVSMALHSGECMALAGQNGAGKSTMVKIITGVYPHGLYSGTVRLAGEVVRIRSPREAEQLGIAVVQQELTVCPTLTVAENLMIGAEPTRLGVIRHDRVASHARSMLSKVGLDLPLDVPAGELSVGHQQMLEIARAVSRRARILILDEPTSSLSTSESEALFTRLAELREAGVGIMYISHRLDELQRLADHVVVFRDGQVVLDTPIAKADRDTVVQSMLGQDSGTIRPSRSNDAMDARAVVMALDNWSVAPVSASDPAVHGVRLSVDEGQILGIYGAVGSGRTELLMSLFGAKAGQGTFTLDGRSINPRSPSAAVRAGIALVSEDRKELGIQPWMSTTENVTLPALGAVSRGTVPHKGREESFAREQALSVGLPERMLPQPVVTLSGGNQQKAMLARALATKPRLLLLDEPTRGVDVGAKADLHATLLKLAAGGIAVVWVSSEAEELVEVAHRILVMRDGALVASYDAGEAAVEDLVKAASSADDPVERGKADAQRSEV